jgi:hypothetical protein
LQLIGAATDVADDIERTVVVSLVGPKRLARECGGVDARGAGKLPDLAKTLALQATKAATYLRDHALDHLTAEGAARPRLVALDANVDAGIEDDRNRQGMPLSRQLDPGLAIGGAEVGGVDNSEFSSLQSLAADFADQIEGIGGSTLVGLIVRDQRQEVLRRESRLA